MFKVCARWTVPPDTAANNAHTPRKDEHGAEAVAERLHNITSVTRVGSSAF
jgi:hypothetical protein